MVHNIIWYCNSLENSVSSPLDEKECLIYHESALRPGTECSIYIIEVGGGGEQRRSMQEIKKIQEQEGENNKGNQNRFIWDKVLNH